VPLALTQAQLDQVMRTAGPIPPYLRGDYLELVARALAGCEIDDGAVYRACRDAAKVVMWNVVRDAEPSEVIGDSKLCVAPTRRGRPIDPVREERADQTREANARRRAFNHLRSEAGERLRVLRIEERS